LFATNFADTLNAANYLADMMHHFKNFFFSETVYATCAKSPSILPEYGLKALTYHSAVIVYNTAFELIAVKRFLM
jgi:hypothetical protein